MDNNIKKTYEKINMSETSKQRIYHKITESNKIEHPRSKNSHWKVIIAASLAIALFIPTSIYAMDKISEYRKVTIQKNGYHAKIQLNQQDDTAGSSSDSTSGSAANSTNRNSKPEKKTLSKKKNYIKITADFGSSYQYRDDSYDYIVDEDGTVTKKRLKIKEGTDGMYTFCHKDGFDAGKDFYYEVIKVDTEQNIDLYDQSTMEELTVNNHRAFLSVGNTIKGSRYTTDFDSSYTINLYLFYDEYGYIINFCGMQGLGKDALIHLAEKIEVADCSKKNASRYLYLSKYSRAYTEQYTPGQKQEIKNPVHSLGTSVTHYGATYKVTDVSVSDEADFLKRADFNSRQLRKKISGLWKKDGSLKHYLRETLTAGDGVSEAELTVTASKQIQLKIVSVTMEVTAGSDFNFDLPDIHFFEEENNTLYDTDLYEQYNRPYNVDDALIDFMPYYFRETAGGSQFYIKPMKKGQKSIYHFSYLIDEDLINHMFLCIDNNGEEDAERQYIDIRK